jgi:hypothetical protein
MVKFLDAVEVGRSARPDQFVVSLSHIAKNIRVKKGKSR